MPVVVGTPSCSQAVRTPWKCTVCGRRPSVLSSVTDTGVPASVRRIGAGTLGSVPSAWNAQTRGDSTGPPIVSSRWTAWRACCVDSVTTPPHSGTSTTAGWLVIGSDPSSRSEGRGSERAVSVSVSAHWAEQPASVAAPAAPSAATSSRRERPGSRGAKPRHTLGHRSVGKKSADRVTASETTDQSSVSGT